MFEPEKYPSAPYLQRHEEIFGKAKWRRQPSSRTGICALGLEPNPKFLAIHRVIEEDYALQGWKVKFLAVAAGDHEGKLVFNLDPDDKAKSDWGFSQYTASMKGHDGLLTEEVKVEAFGDFVGRINATVPSGIRLVKMDIEGSEYDVIPDLLKKGMLCQNTLGHLTIEWHSRSPAFNWTQAELRRFARIEDLATHHSCPASEQTVVEPFDDESYLQDGQALPPPG